jgi:uncharacterized protein YjiS (DUF1127 family)
VPALARRQPLTNIISLGSVFSRFCRFCSGFVDWQAQADERRSLARLDDRLLADIRLTREQQADACARSFLYFVNTGGHTTTRNRIVYVQIW